MVGADLGDGVASVEDAAEYTRPTHATVPEGTKLVRVVCYSSLLQTAAEARVCGPASVQTEGGAVERVGLLNDRIRLGSAPVGPATEFAAAADVARKPNP